MKYMTLILTVAVLLCAPRSFRAATSGLNTEAKAAASAGQKERYQKQVEAKLRQLDREIAALKANAPQEGRQLRRQFIQQMAELDKKREAAQRQLEKFESTGQQAWQDAKPELDAAVKDLATAYARAASDFKQKGRSK
jgi:F0F1-type ATP synthase membrane subunit b/b'